jgi:hypothetical protein
VRTTPGLAGLIALLCACRHTPTPTRVADAATEAAPPPTELLSGGDTFGVIAGVLTFADPKLTPFSDELRKDRELYEVLLRRGVPAKNLSLLLDRDANAASIQRAVDARASSAGPTSTLLFYYAGHGARDDQGRPYFLAYDTSSSGGGLAVDALASRIAERFHGARVVLMGDACYSGALQAAAQKLAAHGTAALALTSADASNLSTENWTFTQTLIDGLSGEALADANGDGVVSLGELDGEVAAAMKYRENQRHGFWAQGIAEDTPVATRHGKAAARAGGYVRVSRAGSEAVARVREPGPSETLVRFYHYNHAEDARVPSSSLSPIVYEHYAPGASLRVFWGDKLWDARVRERDGDFQLVTYPGWPSYWDEWILSDRVATTASPSAGAGAAVQVEWRGRWYPATVLKRTSKRALIHYDGYDSSWDEWVGPARLRKR